MAHRRVQVYSLVVVAALAAACAKHPPKAPPPTVTPVAPEVSVPEAESTPDVTERPLPSDLVELNAEVARRGLLGDVFFAFDQASLDEGARARLAKNAEFLAAYSDYTVTVEGHCDERGTNEYNLALGARRAGAARDYILNLGVAPGRLQTISYGEERPQCSESSEECWTRNRRVHFLITGRTTQH